MNHSQTSSNWKSAFLSHNRERVASPSLSLSSSSLSSPLSPSSKPAICAVDCGIVNVYINYTWPCVTAVSQVEFCTQHSHTLSLFLRVWNRRMPHVGSMMLGTWTLSGRIGVGMVYFWDMRLVHTTERCYYNGKVLTSIRKVVLRVCVRVGSIGDGGGVLTRWVNLRGISVCKILQAFVSGGVYVCGFRC